VDVETNRIDLDRSDDDVIVVIVEGEHDVHTAPTLREEIESIAVERKPFVIDLSSATFIDSSVLRVLLEARRLAQESKVGFAIALDGETPGVSRILEVTGLMPLFPVLGGREDAIEAARSGPAP
jgi:anti-sigma B factor antagonist